MFDPIIIIKTIGLLGICLIIFAETGLFFGFFLPGDTLLFTAGIFASQGFLNIYLLIILCILAAILGDSTGYWSGKRYGRKLFERDAGFFFKKKRIHQAEHFYAKHGKYTIIIARFIPVIRTFAPIVAGIGKMHYKTFLSFNIFGGILWVTFMSLVGYFLGGMFPDIYTYLIPIVILIILVSLLPVAVSLFRHRMENLN